MECSFESHRHRDVSGWVRTERSSHHINDPDQRSRRSPKGLCQLIHLVHGMCMGDKVADDTLTISGPTGSVTLTDERICLYPLALSSDFSTLVQRTPRGTVWQSLRTGMVSATRPPDHRVEEEWLLRLVFKGETAGDDPAERFLEEVVTSRRFDLVRGYSDETRTRLMAMLLDKYASGCEEDRFYARSGHSLEFEGVVRLFLGWNGPHVAAALEEVRSYCETWKRPLKVPGLDWREHSLVWPLLSSARVRIDARRPVEEVDALLAATWLPPVEALTLHGETVKSQGHQKIEWIQRYAELPRGCFERLASWRGLADNKVWNFENAGLCAASVCALLASPFLPILEEASFRGNPLGDGGGVALAEGMRVTRNKKRISSERVDLRGTDAGDAVAFAWAERARREGRPLRWLRLSDNPRISQAGVRALNEAGYVGPRIDV